MGLNGLDVVLDLHPPHGDGGDPADAAHAAGEADGPKAAPLSDLCGQLDLPGDAAPDAGLRLPVRQVVLEKAAGAVIKSKLP